MKENHIVKVTRHDFVKGGLGAGAALTLGLWLPAGRTSADETLTGADLNAFVTIGADDSVTIVMKHLEMGQGTYTGLATLVAEELDASWDQVRTVGAPADATRYNNLFWGAIQGTGGSTAMANSFKQMREAGAAARQMIVAGAAAAWGVSESEIDVRDGRVSHAPSGKQSGFGALLEHAAQQPVPESVFLKDPDEFRLIGRKLPRKDGPSKIDGSATFTQDVRLPGMLTALVAHPPRFGATVASFDAAAAKQIAGVEDVVQVPSGVAVLAGDFWTAQKGREALVVEWDESRAYRGSSEQIMAGYRELAKSPGAVARSDGDVAQGLAGAARKISAEFEYPFLAHAAMEPMNCVLRFDGKACEVWNGAQIQTLDRAAIASVLGIEPADVTIHMLYAGGSFGRRANPASDYLREAAHIAKAHGKDNPIKLVWTREDDMQGGWYRPMYFHRIEAGLDDDGRPVAWDHRIVGQSIAGGTAFEQGLVRDGVDTTSVEGASDLPYAIPNIRVDLHTTTLPVPIQWWRSVGSTHTAFTVETIIDELAVAAGADPVEYRMSLLDGHPRHQAVLKLVADKAGWSEPLPAGRFRGVALHESFRTRVGQIAEIAVADDGSFSVERVVIAVDCGIAINPDIIVAQMEGGMAYGLAAALESEITLEDGRVMQDNFDGYRVLRMPQMPEVEVHIVKSAEPPTGVGEPATPVIAPAVANALAAAGRERARRLPLMRG